MENDTMESVTTEKDVVPQEKSNFGFFQDLSRKFSHLVTFSLISSKIFAEFSGNFLWNDTYVVSIDFIYLCYQFL